MIQANLNHTVGTWLPEEEEEEENPTNPNPTKFKKAHFHQRK